MNNKELPAEILGEIEKIGIIDSHEHLYPESERVERDTDVLEMIVRAKDEASKVLAFYNDVLERIEALPGVRRAGAISRLPLEGGTNATMLLSKMES